jgi:hypothetical protein
MRDSAAAAQALQGPLDGGWTLRDAGRRPLYAFQITDPAGGIGPVDAAWRAAGPSGAIGVASAIARQGKRLTITFTPEGAAGAAEVRLTRRRAGVWSGRLTEDGRTRRVTLVRAR